MKKFAIITRSNTHKKTKTIETLSEPSEKSSSLKSSTKMNDNHFTCKIRLLDDTQVPLECSISKTDLGKCIFTFVCNAIGNLIETDYFGLRYTDRHGERQWLDLDRVAYKQLKESKSTSVNFRLKHYPSDPIRDLKQELTRYLVYLQIRRDLMQGRLLCPPNLFGTIGSLIAQAELGDAPPPEDLNLSRGYETPNVSISMPEQTATPSLILDASTGNQSFEDVPKAEEYLKNFKMFISQTPDIIKEVMKKHQELRGCKSQDAETKLLYEASKLPTYGIDPFPVVPKHKVVVPQPGPPMTVESGDQDSSKLQGSSHASPKVEPVKLSKNKPFYLGISWTGLVTFIGLQRATEYHWNEIQRLACDDRQFLVFLKEHESKPWKRLFRHKSNQLIFECESKAAALALWRWTVDRKCFFTLSEGSQAKRLRPNSSVFHRHTFRFSGRSYKELDKVNVGDVANDFTRVSSLRRELGSASVGHVTSGSSRLRPPLLPSEEYQISEVVGKPIEPVPLVEADQLDAVIEQTFEEDNVAVQHTKPANGEDGIVEPVTESIPGPVEDKVIEATSIPQQLVSNVDVAQYSKLSSEEPIKAEIRERLNRKAIQQVTYEHVVSTLDHTIDAHTADLHASIPNEIYSSSNGASKRNGSLSTRMNGPCKHQVIQKKELLNEDHASRSQYTPVHSEKPIEPTNLSRNLAVTAATMFVIIGLIVFMETTTEKTDSTVLGFLRGNPIISGLDGYVYSPIRNAIVGSLSIFWS